MATHKGEERREQGGWRGEVKISRQVQVLEGEEEEIFLRGAKTTRRNTTVHQRKWQEDGGQT